MCNQWAFRRKVCADRCSCQLCISELFRRYARVMYLVGTLSSEPKHHILDRRHHRQPITSSLQQEQELAVQDLPNTRITWHMFSTVISLSLWLSVMLQSCLHQRKHTLCLSCHSSLSTIIHTELRIIQGINLPTMINRAFATLGSLLPLRAEGPHLPRRQRLRGMPADNSDMSVLSYFFDQLLAAHHRLANRGPMSFG